MTTPVQQTTGQLKAKGRNSLEKIIYAGLFAQGVRGRRGLPYVLVGKPGTAKTSITEQIAQSAGLYFESIVSSLRAPYDFLGLGVPSKLKLDKHNAHLSPDMEDEIMVMKYAPANFAINVATHQRAVLLLDEVNTAPPAVQAALLRLLFEGVCGELQLPPGVRMMLAMNHTEEAAGGWDIAPPLANRVGWLDWEVTAPNQFIEYLMSQGAQKQSPEDPTSIEDQVDAAWTNMWAKVAGQVAGFLSAKGDQLFQMPSISSKQVSAAWASPRTWELATRAKTVGSIFNLSDKEIDTSITAFVGSGASGEFHTWVKNNDLPDPVDFLDGIVPFQHNPKRLDRTAAVLTSATSLITSTNKSPADIAAQPRRIEALWKFHEGLATQAPDLSLGSVIALCNARMMVGHATAYKVLAKMEPVMVAAGVTPSAT